MALIDDLEQKYGLSGSARSNISNIQSQTGGDLLGSIESKYGISSGSLIDNVESKYGLGGKPKVQQQTQQPTQVPAYTGPVQTNSPLSFGQRTGLATENSLEGKKNILKQMGFETLQDQQGNLLVKQGDKVFPVDEKGFSIGDIADFVGGQIPTIGAVGGAALGSVVPGIGTAAGAALGGAAGAGLGDLIRQKIAQTEGSKQGIDLGETAIQSAVGGVAGLIPGGKIVQGIIEKFGGNVIIDKLVATGARQTIESATTDLLARGASEATASRYATDLISSELSKTVAGRAAINATVGSLIGAGQGGVEAGYHGGSASDILQGVASGFGSGLIYGPAFGEVLHQGIGVAKMALPNPSLENQLLREFATKTPTIEEVKSFIDNAKATPDEKTRVLSLVESGKPIQAPEVQVPEAPNKINLPRRIEGDISVEQIRRTLKDNGYDTATINDAISTIETTLKGDQFRNQYNREPTYDPKNVEAILNKTLPDVPTNSANTRGVTSENIIQRQNPDEPPHFILQTKDANGNVISEQSFSTRAEAQDNMRPQNAAKIETVPTQVPATEATAPKLPKGLAGAKLNYKQTKLAFDSDLDKALYIVAANTESASHGKYMDWLRAQYPELSDTQIKAKGNSLKKAIGNIVNSNPDSTTVPIPEINKVGVQPLNPQAIAAEAVKPSKILKTQQPLTEQPLPAQAQDIANAKAITEVKPQEPGIVNQDNTVNIEKLYETSLGQNKIVPKVGVMGKFLDAVTNTFDPKDAKAQWRRAVGRTFASVRKVLNGFGDVGEGMVKTFDEITKAEDKFSAKAKEAAGTFTKYVKENLTPEQNQEQQLLRIKNNVANTTAEGRSKIRTPEEVMAQTSDPKVKEALRLYFEATKEISQALNGRWYKVNGEAAYKAGEPSLFHPRDYGIENVPDNTIKINNLAQEMLNKNPDLTMRQAEANARAQIENQQQHSSKVTSGYGVEKPINTIDEAKAAGFELDDARALEYFINKNAKTAAIMDVLGKKGIYETSGIKDTQDGEQVVEEAKKAIGQYYNQIQSDFAKEIDRYVEEKKFSPKEGQAFREVLSHYMDFSFKGGDVGELWNAARKIQALKLGASGLNNFFQPFLNLLKGDFPSFYKGIRAAWFRSASAESIARLNEFGFKDLNDLTVQSGAKQHQYLETPQETTGQTILDKATKVTGAGLKVTETGNRQGAAIAGFDFMYRGSRILNDPNTSISTKISLANDLSELLGREVKPGEPLKLTKDDALNAAYNFTKATQFGYDPLNLPHWANTGWGKTIFQFKSFVYNSTRLAFESTIGELQQGNTGRATRNMMVLGLLFPLPGEAIRAFRHYILGVQNKDDNDIMKRWFNDVGNLVGLGFLDSAINSTDGNAFIINMIGGPTAGTGAQVYDWITKSGSDVASGEIGKTLEDTFNFTAKQFGGLGSGIKNQIVGPLTK